MEGIFFLRENNLQKFKSTDVAFDSRQDNMKIQANADPAHIGILEYTVPGSPADGTLELFEIEHRYEYPPAAIVRRNQKDSDTTFFLTTRISGAGEEYGFFYRAYENVLKIFYYQVNGTGSNPFANTTQEFIYEIYGNPGGELVTL